MKKLSKKLKSLFFRELVTFKNPKKLARTLGVGMCLGIVPIPGISSILCILTSAILRLRLVIVLSIHWIMFPFQIILYPLFISSAIWLFNIPISFNDAGTLRNLLTFQKNIILVHLSAALLWIIFCSIFYLIAYNQFFRIAKRILKLKNKN